MISQRRFLVQLGFEAVTACFFMYLAVQFLPTQGWDVLTIFCCLFATTSVVRCFGMIQTYREIRRIQILKMQEELFNLMVEAKKEWEEEHPEQKNDAHHSEKNDE